MWLRAILRDGVLVTELVSLGSGVRRGHQGEPCSLSTINSAFLALATNRFFSASSNCSRSLYTCPLRSQALRSRVVISS